MQGASQSIQSRIDASHVAETAAAAIAIDRSSVSKIKSSNAREMQPRGVLASEND